MLDGIERGTLHGFVGRYARLMNTAIKLAPRRSSRPVQQQMGQQQPAAP